MSKRKQVSYNKVVGVKDNEIYLVNYTFEDTLYDKPFKGVTGSVLVPLSQDEIDARGDLDQVIDSYGYLWVEAVNSGSTTLSQEDYMQDLIDQEDGYFLGHDLSDVHYIEDNPKIKELFPEAVTYECVGGGRCFKKNMEFDIVFDQHLLDEINRLEEKEE